MSIPTNPARLTYEQVAKAIAESPGLTDEQRVEVARYVRHKAEQVERLRKRTGTRQTLAGYRQQAADAVEKARAATAAANALVTTDRDLARAAVDRVQKRADDDRTWTPRSEVEVLDTVAKAVGARVLTADDVWEAMGHAARRWTASSRGLLDEVEAYVEWKDTAPGEVVKRWHDLYEDAPRPTVPKMVSAPTPGIDLDSVSRAARTKHPGLDEVEAVAKYLDTPEGVEHYAREHG